MSAPERMTDAALIDAAVAATGWPLATLAREVVGLASPSYAYEVRAGTKRLGGPARKILAALAAGLIDPHDWAAL